MKKIFFIIGLLGLLTSNLVFANANTKQTEILKCTDNANTKQTEILECTAIDGLTKIQVILDSSTYKEGSTFKDPVSANLSFHFSTVQNMTCSGFVRGSDYSRVKCAGYYHYKQELTELKMTNEGNKIIANWTTSIGYGSVKKKTECTLKSI